MNLAGLSLSLSTPRGGSAAAVPGSSLTTLPTTPAARWSAAFSTVTKTGSRVTAATDLMGLADLAEVSSSGPTEMTDGLGRKFWRFDANSTDYLSIASSLVTDSRALAVFMVGRFYSGIGTILGMNGYQALRTASSVPGVPYLQAGSRIATSDTLSRAKYAIPGLQNQVIWMASRALNATQNTADKNTLLGINDTYAQVASLTSFTGVTGGEIGRAFGAATYGYFDMYEMIVYTSALTDAQATAIAAAITANWDFATLTNQLVMEGDSITEGVSIGDASQTRQTNAASRMTSPGLTSTFDNTWRVVLSAGSGATCSTLVTRRDQTNNIFANGKLSGRNVVSMHIGVNDMPARTASAIYSGTDAGANICDIIDTTTTGYRQNGWETVVAVSIASSNATVQGIIDTLRTSLRDVTQLRTDTGATTATEVRIVDLAAITSSADTVFSTSADAGDATWYADGVHPNVAGESLMATGGDDATKGYYARILATTD